MNTILNRYHKYGKGYHFIIESVQDLADAAELDEALWVATAAPADSFRVDSVMLEQLDTLQDKRITAGEVKQAIEWTLCHLKKQDDLQRGETSLIPEHIDTSARNGKAIADALGKIRSAQNSNGAVTLLQIRALKKQIEQQPISGSGVILPDAGQDADITAFLQDIITCTGGTPHPGGAKGVNDKVLETFQQQARQYIAWFQAGVIPEDKKATAIKPYGENTASAFSVFNALREKFEQFFILCSAVQLDPTLRDRAWPRDPQVAIQDISDIEEIQRLLHKAPLAPPDPEATFDFSSADNPAFSKELHQFRELILQDASVMTHKHWQEICSSFSDFKDWRDKKPGNMFDTLGLEKLEQYLDDKYTDAVRELIRGSRVSSVALDQLCLAEKLALFQGNLMSFTNNFISMPDLYTPEKRALFEEGTLIMDGRHFNLCIRVFDRREHTAITEKGKMFIMYLQLDRSTDQCGFEIAVPVAAGTRGGLVEGKRGIFKHVDGTEWNARIIQIIGKPISLTEAALAPFAKLGEAITGKIEALSGTAGKQLEKAGSDSVTMIETATREKKLPDNTATTIPQGAPGNIGGLLAGAGVAVAALGSSFAFILKMIASITNWWKVGAGIGGAILAVMVPALIVAAIRLRKRDIKNLLEGSGWAINVPMRLSRRQKSYITSRPARPSIHS